MINLKQKIQFSLRRINKLHLPSKYLDKLTIYMIDDDDDDK